MKHNSEKVEKEKWKQLHQVNHPLARSSSLLCHVKESLFRKHFFSAEFHWIFEPFDESLLTLLAETIKKAFCGLNFWRKLFCFSTFTIQLYNGWRENFSRIKGVERLHWILLCIRCWLSRGLRVVRKMTRNEFLCGKYYKVILTLKKISRKIWSWIVRERIGFKRFCWNQKYFAACQSHQESDESRHLSSLIQFQVNWVPAQMELMWQPK